MKTKNLLLIAAKIIFAIYLFILIVSVFPVYDTSIIVGNKRYLESIGQNIFYIRFNIVPFIDFFSENYSLKEIVKNIILFIPMWLFLSIFIKKRIVLIGFFVAMIPELLQFFIGYYYGIFVRVVDVNDFICNYFGFLIGYIAFLCISYFKK